MSEPERQLQPVDLDAFLNAVQSSALLTRDQFSTLIDLALAGRIRPEPYAIAAHLVQKNLCTRWQAQQLVVGQANFNIGRYRVLDRIGSGGMATVYKAVEAKTQQIVAVKVLGRNMIGNQEAVARFEREVRAATLLRHPNIVAAYDAGADGELHFMVMEFVEGYNLDKWVEEHGRLPFAAACECIRQCALGLQCAHEKGLVHRDIKPANLVVTWKGQSGFLVKILDMGMARFVSESSQDKGLTKTGQIMGTPDYIAPEQARNTRAADIRADIFSLGCTLYKLLTNDVPFEGKTPMARLVAKSSGHARSLSALRPDAPPDLETALAKMLALEPQDRYAVPIEVAQAMTAVLQKIGVGVGDQGLRYAFGAPGTG